jgi:hypothetical protein
MNTLKEVQKWFRSHCDGDWEHGGGIRISTLDNPGWAAEIDVNGTELSDKSLAITKIERDEANWLWTWTEEGRFLIRCGTENLEEGLQAFLDWTKR